MVSIINETSGDEVHLMTDGEEFVLTLCEPTEGPLGRLKEALAVLRNGYCSAMVRLHAEEAGALAERLASAEGTTVTKQDTDD